MTNLAAWPRLWKALTWLKGRWPCPTCSDVPFKGMRPPRYHFMVLQRPSAAACLSPVYLCLQLHLYFLCPTIWSLWVFLEEQCSSHSWGWGGVREGESSHALKGTCSTVTRQPERDHVPAEWCDGLPLPQTWHCCLWWLAWGDSNRASLSLRRYFLLCGKPCQKQRSHLKGQGAREAYKSQKENCLWMGL